MTSMLERFTESVKWKIFRKRLVIEDRRSAAFDARYGVDTAAEAELGACGVPPEDVSRGNGVYRVTWGWLTEKALSRLDIDWSRYTFLDLGSGKGKAMLQASNYPYRRIVGIEYAKGLHETAAANFRVYRDPAQKCRDLESIHGDVRDFPIPPGPLVCFMCNPFDHDTMRVVFRRLRERSEQGEKDLRIMYLNMRTIDEMMPVLREQHWLRSVARERNFVIYAPKT